MNLLKKLLLGVVALVILLCLVGLLLPSCAPAFLAVALPRADTRKDALRTCSCTPNVPA